MKKSFLISLLIILTSISYGQDKIYGHYKNNLLGPNLEISPDSDSLTLSYTRRIKDTFTYYYTIDNDTLKVFTGVDSLNENIIKRYLISRLDLFENSEAKEINLFLIYESDTIISDKVSGKISDYEAIYFNNFEMYQGYFDNGNISFKIDHQNDMRFSNCYHSNGKLRFVKIFKRAKSLNRIKRIYKPYGTWYYYDENSNMTKIETYRRGKLRKSITF